MHRNPDRKASRQIKTEIRLSQAMVSNSNSELRPAFMLYEFTDAIKELKAGKAPGPDGIHNEFLIHAGTTMWTWLTTLFNVCLQENTLLKMWRRSSVTALLKPDKLQHTLPTSYRPISLLCTTTSFRSA